MDTKTAAQRLHGMEYRSDAQYKDIFAEMKAAGLVAVMGASDDLIDLQGAINDEYGAGSPILFWDGAILENECEEERCPYFEKIAKKAVALTADHGHHPDVPGEPHWVIDFPIEHETFDVMEDDEVFCRGIIFALRDIP